MPPRGQVMFALFTALLVAWCGLLATRRALVKGIHGLMGALVLFKALSLLAQVRECFGTGVCMHATARTDLVASLTLTPLP